MAEMNAPFKPMMGLTLLQSLSKRAPSEKDKIRWEEGALLYCITVSIYPKNGHLPGPSVHGILQVRILEWVSILFSRGSSQPRDWTWVSCMSGRFFTIWAIREVHLFHNTVQRRSERQRKDKVKFPVWIFIVIQRIFYSTIHQKDRKERRWKNYQRNLSFYKCISFSWVRFWKIKRILGDVSLGDKGGLD